MNKPLLALASVAEALTGVGLLVAPALATRMLFGAEVAGVGALVSRIAGISLVSLGVACWPDNAPYRAGYGMFTYSFLAMLYLAYLGIGGEWTGILLWPGVVIHAGLSAFLIRAWAQHRETAATGEESARSNRS